MYASVCENMGIDIYILNIQTVHCFFVIISGLKDVNVIDLDSVTGEIIKSSQVPCSKKSYAGVSVDGSIYSTSSASHLAVLDSLQSGLDKIEKTENSSNFNDGAICSSTEISNSSNSVCDIGDHIQKNSQISIQNSISVSSAVVTVPQVVIVDHKAGPSLLGKRPAEP